MSKYWKNMFIVNPDKSTPLKDSSGNSIVISKQQPIPYDLLGSIDIDYNADPNEICEFFNRHNLSTDGTTSVGQIDIITVKLTKKTNTVVIALKYQKTNKIIGVIFASFLSIRVFDGVKCEAIPHAHTYNMCVHSKLRKKGMCMALIREVTQFGYKNGMYCGYHIVPSPHTSNFIKVHGWIRVVNRKLAKINGFEFNNNSISAADNTNTTNPNPNNTTLYMEPDSDHYTINEPSGLIFEKLTSNNSDKYFWMIPEIMCTYKFAFLPDQKTLKMWCSTYDTYIVVDNKLPVGVFSINITHPYNSNTKKQTTVANLIWCAGKQPHTLNMALYVSKYKYNNVNVLFGYQMSGITKNTINSVHGESLPTASYFELYNNALQFDAEDVSVPLL